MLSFFNAINNHHRNITFTKEEQQTDSDEFSFLDVNIIKQNDKFHTHTYYKPTHTGLYTNWYSFTPRKYKINLVKTLLSRAWDICSTYELFDHDVKVIKNNLIKNQYPEAIIDPIVKKFIASKMENRDIQPTVATVEKKEVLVILPYHGKLSSKLFMQLKKLLSLTYPQVSLQLIFRTTYRVHNMFQYKDPIPLRFISNVVYGIHCTYCDSLYVGKTKRQLEVRFKEHTNHRNPTAVTSHMLQYDHRITFDDMSVITHGKNDTELLIKESLVCKFRKPALNNNVKSYPLECF